MRSEANRRIDKILTKAEVFAKDTKYENGIDEMQPSFGCTCYTSSIKTRPDGNLGRIPRSKQATKRSRMIYSHNSHQTPHIAASLILVTTLALASATAALGGPPTRVPSFGPNGTHWPSLIDTPFMYDAASTPHVVNVACSWSAISSALANVTATQAAAGVLILVADGTLSGNGNGEGSSPAISQRGSSGWSKRVTIAPANGQGKVRIVNARIDRVKGVCWAGFNYDGVLFHGCDRGAAAWGISGVASSTWFGVFGQSGSPVDSFEVVEIVDRTTATSNSDSSAVYTGGGNISNMRFDGCYWAPHFLSDPLAHVDALQFESVNGGSIGTVTIRDSIYFASNNAAVQVAGGSNVSFVKSALVGGSISLARYPRTAGSIESGYYGSLNGAGTLSFTECLVWNPTSGGTVTTVTNSKINSSTALRPSNGSWSVSTVMTLESEGVMQEPTDAYLRSIWSAPPETPATVPASPGSLSGTPGA